MDAFFLFSVYIREMRLKNKIMHISKTSAKQIVNEISKLVKQNINLMDENGCIIASCDKNRIGQFHEGAYKVISEGLEEYYITEEMATDTARKGLNLPLELDGEIVGVVGIAGSYDEVITLGRLIKKMTEILLMEARTSYHQLMDKRVRNAFLEEWVLNTGYVNFKDLEEKGHALNIDINRPRRVMIASVEELNKYKETQEGQDMISKFENEIDAYLNNTKGTIHFRNISRQIILVESMPTEQMIQFSKKIAKYVFDKTGFRLNIGIDSGDRNVHDAYLQADRAWRSASDERQEIVCYENMSLELILSCVPAERKSEYVDKIFTGCSQNEIKEYVNMLNLYFKTDGSIQKTSELMYVHKNTLQYRINKLKEISGYDVRKPNESAALYIAMKMAYDLDY